MSINDSLMVKAKKQKANQCQYMHVKLASQVRKENLYDVYNGSNRRIRRNLPLEDCVKYRNCSFIPVN